MILMNKLNNVEKKFTVNNEFVTYGFHYNPAHFKKVTNNESFLNKPSGGLWSSPKKCVSQRCLGRSHILRLDLSSNLRNLQKSSF